MLTSLSYPKSLAAGRFRGVINTTFYYTILTLLSNAFQLFSFSGSVFLLLGFYICVYLSFFYYIQTIRTSQTTWNFQVDKQYLSVTRITFSRMVHKDKNPFFPHHLRSAERIEDLVQPIATAEEEDDGRTEQWRSKFRSGPDRQMRVSLPWTVFHLSKPILNKDIFNGTFTEPRPFLSYRVVYLLNLYKGRGGLILIKCWFS